MTDEELKEGLFNNLLFAYKLSENTTKAWGENVQLDKTIEECAELIVALQHSRSRTLDIRVLASEIADVFVMIICAARIVGVDLVSDEMNKKLNRLKGRLENVKIHPDLEEKYNKAVQLSEEMKSRYHNELARSEEFRRQLLEIQASLQQVDSRDEAAASERLEKSRKNVRKQKISKRKK